MFFGPVLEKQEKERKILIVLKRLALFLAASTVDGSYMKD